MLDTTTKRRIDTARDILVGKVPDPKSQVEQITIALIYKFMDDMDAQGEELGGIRKFFAGDFARYGWAKLMRSGLGGHETLNLYAEAISKMPENPGIPPLFREIFKNAFLPYRDPETLKSFLKIIDEFEYDHSEKLGDAFEYLLSVLGSQGDAGQFRTPRHIIDFMVEIIAPKKNETVLDPACGTAGFLISAYKHILKTNTDTNGQSTLTPDDRKKLAENFKGYDISPDMVRLSLVNLYLHGFTDPHVYEYDTLTSEERWNETADVILANPPFMSPKGGIKPHQRFSVQAKRSEVLFVDYIAEHLSSNGRAAIIVPEGIIFQSQTAYVQLRKLLVENYLVAVISLPAGIFNPYSGVKTSILIMDKVLAKQSSTIGFFKIENDGFSLGAQRRENGKDDLPQVKADIESYLNSHRSRQSVEELNVRLGLIVQKEKLSSNGEFNLVGERYREGATAKAHFPSTPLIECCEVNPESGNPSDLFRGTHFNYIDISCVENETGKFLGATSIPFSEAPSRARRIVKKNDILLSTVRPNLRAFAILDNPPERAIASTGFAVLRAKANLLPAFLIRMIRHNSAVDQMIGMSGKGAYPSINQSDVERIQIPLPPLDTQKEIVAEIESYQKIINGARAVIDNYRPHIPIDPKWPKQKLADVAFFQEGPGILAEDFKSDGVPLIRLAGLRDGTVTLKGCNFLDPAKVASKWSQFALELGDILVLTSASFGSPAVVDAGTVGAIFYTGIIRFKPKSNDLDSKFLRIFLGSDSFLEQAESLASGAVIRHFGPTHLRQMILSLPPIELQRQISEEIVNEQSLVAANRELIIRFEAKIQATLARVWGEATT